MANMESLRRKRRARLGLPAPAARRALREEAGLSQQDLADALGVKRETISRWERDERHPRGRYLLAYVELLRELREP